MKHVALVIALAMLFLFNMAHATVWYVHPDSAMNCIDDCLDSCSIGDTVLVGPGTYTENIIWPVTAGIDLVSEHGADTTIIDGDSSNVVIHLSGTIDTTTKISGFTIMNGYHINGGGIYCDNASPIIEDNIITENTGMWCGGIVCRYPDAAPLIANNSIINNHADSTGGGIYCFNYAHPMVLYNIIGSNTAVWGGGICCQTGCSPTITGNTIISNTAIHNGGGIGCYNSSSPIIEGNLISENVSGYEGGGIYCYQNSSPIIKRNAINLNTAAGYGAAVHVTGNSSPQIDSCTIAHNNYDGIFCYDGSNPTISYCNIYGHTNNGVWNSDPNLTIDAENCWWGHATGPWHPTANPGGQGDPVSDHVDFDPWLDDSVSGIGVEEFEIANPLALHLQISPNPFRHTTNIRYTIHESGYTIQNPTLSIYDATGRLVKSFSLLTYYLSNSTSVVWDGRDDQNRMLGSGVYFAKFSAGDHTETKKVLLIK